jgi:type I restriction enzyme S subunit
LTNGFPFDSERFGPEKTLPLVRIRDLFLEEFATYVSGPVPDHVVLRDGDIVIGMDGDFELTVWRRGPAALNQRMCLLRPRSGVDARFVAYALPRHLRVLNELTYATTVKHLSSFDILSERILCPTDRAQRAIADYLDEETTGIDSLVDRKRDLLNLLATRRASFIAALVAGKPDSSPRADLNWLPAVPSSWPSVPLGLVADVFNGSTPDQKEADGGEIAWTASGEIDQGVIRVPTAYISDESRRAHGLRVAPVGSIVVGLVGQGRTRGLSARLAIATTLNQNLAAICPRDDRLDPTYVGLMLELAYDDLRNGGRGGNQAALNCEMIKAYRIPIAPRDEQASLVNVIAAEQSRDGAMAALLTRSIELLFERRQALITAAVTGELGIPRVAA